MGTNLRGGGEYGENGIKQEQIRKQNVFDISAAAEYLIAEKYTNPNKLAIEGGSNGGLLVLHVVIKDLIYIKLLWQMLVYWIC